MTAMLVALGWTLVSSVWLSALLAILVWAGVRFVRSSPTMRHALAMGGLCLTLLAALGTFVLLVRPAPTSRERSAQAEVVRSSPAAPRPASPAVISTREVGAALTSLVPPRLVAAVGLVWVAVTSVLLVRALGGVFVISRMRRRAIPLRSAALRQMVERVARRMGLRTPLALLESAEVEAPAALGLSRATLVFPLDLEAKLGSAHLELLVAHELEHLRGRDPLFAAAQLGLDAVLCFCPGARWLSAQAREAREQRCDDAAVAMCDDRAVYASALGALASLGCCAGSSPALGVSGGSLVERIRRILKGDAMPRVTPVQVTSLAIGLMALGWSGPALWGAATEQVRTAHGAADGETAGTAQGQAPFLAGWVPAAGDSPVRLVSVKGNSDYACETVQIRNISESPIVGVALVAIVEFLPWDRPVELIESGWIPVSLRPGESVGIDTHFLSAAQIEDTKRRGRPQAMLSLSATRASDGTEWRITPRRDARSAAEALYAKDTAFVSRALVESTPPATTTAWSCLDDRGYTYSRGAIVPILGEKRFARCAGGAWIDIGTLGEPQAPPQG